MQAIYMDYNATTPVREEVRELFERTVRDTYGNPSSLYLVGRQAKALLDASREKVAGAINARPSEIVFTSGGSESVNLAIKGIALQRGGGHVITSAVEHPCVLETCRFLQTHGFAVTYVPVDDAGRVEISAVQEAIRDDTFLLTIMWANNETGVLQKIEKIGELARDRGIVFHTDAVQVLGKIPIDVRALSVDLLSLSGHKVCAPKGVGALYARRGIVFEPLIHGGGQERNLRSGTENVPGVAAMAEACRLAASEIDHESPRIRLLRDDLEKRILSGIPGSRVNGRGGDRLPNTSNVTFPGAEGEAVIIGLDEYEIAASSASACAASHADPSHVLLAMGLSREDAEATIRLSLGKHSTAGHIMRLGEILPGIITRLRSLTDR
ncbi:MAG: cysteine desulfurase family protein [Candidatus Latescibacterota bacterium]